MEVYTITIPVFTAEHNYSTKTICCCDSWLVCLQSVGGTQRNQFRLRSVYCPQKRRLQLLNLIETSPECALSYFEQIYIDLNETAATDISTKEYLIMFYDNLPIAKMFHSLEAYIPKKRELFIKKPKRDRCRYKHISTKSA